MKKLLAILLSFAMVFSLASVSVFAENSTQDKGSITIQGASTGSTYEIYKMLDLHSFDTTSGRYSYQVAPKWANFFKTTEALKYVAVDNDGYVNWISQKAEEQQREAPEFAKAALAWAKENGITPEKSTKNPEDYTITGTTIKFADLDTGYYLVDSTVGALCGLTTTNLHPSITAKNVPPTLEKYVQEDSTNAWVKDNTADMGQTVNFKTEISVHDNGAQNYVLHDIMEDGFTFKGITSIAIKDDTDPVTEGTHYNVFTKNGGTEDTNTDDDTADGCTFEVRFTPEFCGKLQEGDVIEVYYSAVLNTEAVIAGEGNKNTAKLSYGEENETAPSTTVTKTFAFDIVKTDNQNQLIEGAKFKLYKAATGTESEVKLVKISTGLYRVASEEEIAGNTLTDIEVEIVTASEATATPSLRKGTARVIGLDNDTYYLEETVAPLGYNKLAARKVIRISDSNHDAIFSATGSYSTGSGIQIINQTGAMLPGTGGMGTMLFVTIGAIVVIGAGVLLVTKKRMSMIED